VTHALLGRPAAASPCVTPFIESRTAMWKILVGFVMFAGVAMYILTRSGADVDMGGEKHSVEAAALPALAASAAAIKP
jgi:hypothetical protein